MLQRFPDPAAALFLVLGDFNDDKAGKALQRLCGRGKTTIAELLPVADSRGETWTHVYRKEDSYARVDHILASPGLRARAVVLSARIYDGEGARAASDHRPVVLTLTLPPEKK
ncbi:MAG TPA: endonuclease/exonuclease/phosphatase family protein [Opitutus sp.]|nr:endonuclease/exonuclease/phosphatase family protein [Opitutus sp.]